MQDLMTQLNTLLISVDFREWLLVLMTPFFVIALALEWLHFRGTKIFTLQDSFASLSLGGIYLVIEGLFQALLLVHIYGFFYTHRLFTIEITALSFVGLFIGLEFFYYWFHRSSHRVRWFWAAHVAHHASEHMNFTTASRQSALYFLGGYWIFYIPLVSLGFEPIWVLFMYSLNLAYQFFIHTQWIPKLHPAIEYVFNTPSHHRAHHGRNPRYIDKNYGGTFIIFDRLFGTFSEESEDEPVDYGITRQINSFNPIWLNLHEWVDMFRDVLKPGPLWLRLKHLWMPPEWERPSTTTSITAESDDDWDGNTEKQSG
jgi:sterol desaturase/sphingolipid hydroxylase (fatty acid hydroxylase superfamily)